MNTQLLKAAINQAEKSKYRHRVGAVLFKDSKILSYGFNATNHSNSVKTSHKFDSLHAEASALSKMIRTGRMKECYNASMLVVRLRKDGTLALALPCEDCYRLMKACKIKTCYFSNDDGLISEIKL